MICNVDLVHECGIFGRDELRFTELFKESLFPQLYPEKELDFPGFDIEFETDDEEEEIKPPTYNDLLESLEVKLRVKQDLIVHYLLIRTLPDEKIASLAEFINSGMRIEYLDTYIHAENLCHSYTNYLSNDMIEFLDQCLVKKSAEQSQK